MLPNENKKGKNERGYMYISALLAYNMFPDGVDTIPATKPQAFTVNKWGRG